MVVVAQLVRASVCGTEGRGFESRLPPKKMKTNPFRVGFFCTSNFDQARLKLKLELVPEFDGNVIFSREKSMKFKSWTNDGLI